jgi:hypothetical protein
MAEQAAVLPAPPIFVAVAAKGIHLVQGEALLLLACLLAGGMLLAIGALVLLRFRRRPGPGPAEPGLAIDVAELPADGPPAEGVVLECYGVPVRLAVLVLAPLGRAEFPQQGELLRLIDDLVPGLSQVFATHSTLVRRWPPQLSPRGFGVFFASQIKLPGNRGKGTSWCSVAGKAEGVDGPLMVGMVLRAGRPNSLGQFSVERPSQWLDILRVRGAA